MSSSIHVAVIGGTPAHRGGVEAFCERAQAACAARGTVRLTITPAESAFLRIAQLPRFVARLFGTFRALRRDRPDAVWLQYVNLPDLAYVLVARLAGRKVMITPHLGANWRSQANPVLRWTSTRLIAMATSLATLSATQAREVAFPAALPRYPIRTYLPAEIWDAPLPDGAERGPMRLVHSGRLSAGKGTFLFVEVCAELDRRGVPFRAQIAGGADDATLAELRALIARHGLEQRIELLGLLPNSAVVPLLGASDILVHLSRIDSYPLIVLESLACGTFPICLDMAGARDMIATYRGHLADTVAEVADYLAGVDIASLRQGAGAVAARVREDYRWDACAGQLEAAFLQTLGRS